MRAALIAIGLSAITTVALGSPPYANELMLPAGGTAAMRSTDPTVPSVARGQFVGLACASIERAATDAVRVVLLTGADAAATGFSGVLATEQEISGNTVHVRVPDLPDLVQHVVHIKVFVTDASGLHSCDGGKIKIV